MKYLIWPLIILLVFVRYFSTRPIYKNGDKIRITSTVYSDPIVYANSQYIKLGGLKIYLPSFPEVSYGDTIVVEGVVDGKKLLSPKLVGTFEKKNWLSDFRKKIVDFYRSFLPEPAGGLLAGVVLGSKGGITANFWEMVKKTGVAHVVVASGTNVTFAAGFFFALATLFLPRRKAIPFVILGIILYLFLSGFDAPLIRAAIMAVAAFGAQEAGRLTSSWRNLFLSGGAMLAIKPEWVSDIGFILSFVATASIMLFERRISLKLQFLPKVFRENLATSFAAQIGVAPILFVTFGQFNIWSPLVNALVLWTIPLIMVIGAIGGVVGPVLPFLGKIVLWLGYPLLWWFVKIVEIFG